MDLQKLKENRSVILKPIVSEKEWQNKISSLRVWNIVADDNGHVWLGLDNQRVSYDGEQLNIHWSDSTIIHGYRAIVAKVPGRQGRRGLDVPAG